MDITRADAFSGMEGLAFHSGEAPQAVHICHAPHPVSDAVALDFDRALDVGRVREELFRVPHDEPVGHCLVDVHRVPVVMAANYFMLRPRLKDKRAVFCERGSAGRGENHAVDRDSLPHFANLRQFHGLPPCAIGVQQTVDERVLDQVFSLGGLSMLVKMSGLDQNPLPNTRRNARRVRCIAFDAVPGNNPALKLVLGHLGAGKAKRGDQRIVLRVVHAEMTLRFFKRDAAFRGAGINSCELSVRHHDAFAVLRLGAAFFVSTLTGGSSAAPDAISESATTRETRTTVPALTSPADGSSAAFFKRISFCIRS